MLGLDEVLLELFNVWGNFGMLVLCFFVLDEVGW